MLYVFALSLTKVSLYCNALALFFVIQGSK